MAKVSLTTNKGQVAAAEKRLSAVLGMLENLPPNASANVKIEALTRLVELLAQMVAYLMKEKSS